MSTPAPTHRVRRPTRLDAAGALGVGLLVLALFLLGAAPLAAQDPDDADSTNARTERIGTTYRLTEAVLKKYVAAMRETAALARSNPALVQSGDSAAKNAVVVAIFRRAGLSEEELESFMIAAAYAQMGIMGASMSADGERQLQQAPPVVRANVAFLKAHESTFKALQADMNALRPAHERDAERENQLRVTGSRRGELNSEIELEVTGGRHAGRYAAQVSEGGCSYGFAKKGAWGNQYSITTEDPRKFSSLQLIIPDAAAAAQGTDSFLLMATFGPIISLTGPSGTHYKVETSDGEKPEGRGTVKLDDTGEGATVTFDATTKDGVRLKGTIKCYQVMRMGAP